MSPRPAGSEGTFVFLFLDNSISAINELQLDTDSKYTKVSVEYLSAISNSIMILES